MGLGGIEKIGGIAGVAVEDEFELLGQVNGGKEEGAGWGDTGLKNTITSTSSDTSIASTWGLLDPLQAVGESAVKRGKDIMTRV